MAEEARVQTPRRSSTAFRLAAWTAISRAWLGQILAGVDTAQLTGVNQAYEQVA